MLIDKTAIIYGGGGALGSTAARIFAREGAFVFLVDRTQAKLDKVTAEITAAGGQVETAVVDIFDLQAVNRHADAVAAKTGGIDIAFNTVSVMHNQGTQLADLTWEEFIHPVDGFLKAQFNTSKAVSRHMGESRQGVIINMSEPGAKLAIGGILGHAVSSAGKEVFTRILAAELGPNNIRVIGIRPHAMSDAPAAGSYIKDVFQPMANASNMSIEAFMDSMAQGTMTKHLPTLSEVAEIAAFLASDKARSMTGTIINVTAGATID
ncbi:MAG: short-chain dehydrogenase/reductase [Candidatus Saccharibacteria bacterium]|nr:short-chain dehydrogenase/reductase [Candidatus Saccharibacteria bacterium]